MSHSKRNTSLAFFTSYERSLLRSSWGSQSARLSRDSFLPFGYCRLCLMPSRDTVACHGEVGREGKVHLFCRECALNDLMQQRKEIKRLEAQVENEVTEKEEAELRRKMQEEKEEVERFENDMYGLGQYRGGKRKREVEEMHVNSKGSEGREAKRQGQSEKSEASFWIPGAEERMGGKVGNMKKELKLQPLCPGSTPETKHYYSLKALSSVKFSEEASDDSTKEKTRSCPSCKKPLTNSSKPMLGMAEGCGHVVCGSCCHLFNKGRDVRCYVCEANLSGSHVEETTETRKKHKARPRGRLVPISCEGTGFAGGGSNMAKTDGVSFQC